MDMLYLLMQQIQLYGHVRYADSLRKRCGHVRYTNAVRQRYDHVMSVGKVEQFYGHVIFADAANTMVWPC